MPNVNHTKVLKDAITSPIGITGWTHLHKPNTKFSEEGIYETVLKFNPKEKQVKVFLKKLDDIYKSYIKDLKDQGKKVKRGWSIEEDDETGLVQVKYKQKHKQEWMGDRNPIAFFDANMKPFPTVPNISGDSKLIIVSDIVLTFVSNKAYLTLRPKAVQVIELKSFGGTQSKSAEDFGLQKVSGGYSTSANDPEEYEEDEDSNDYDDDVDDEELANYA